jgi:hypothetical protein
MGTAGASSVACTGCAVLDVPFSAKLQAARVLTLFSPSVAVNDRTSGAGGAGTVVNAGKLKVRVYLPRSGNSTYQLMIQQDSGNYSICYSPITAWPSTATSAWTTLEWGLEACAADTAVGRFAMTLLSPSTTDAAVPGRATLWIDAIWIELNGKTIAGPFNFDNANSLNPVGTYYDYQQTYGILYPRPNNPTPPSGTTLAFFTG